jgi:hypothetical protein
MDLFTPSSHDPSPSLAQRVRCTLQQTKLPHLESLDVSLNQTLTALLSSDANCSSPDPINSPLSAVSALPIPITPSISPPFLSPGEGSSNDQFMSAMLATSEESGKGVLYDALRKTITESQGTLPPSKKRGIGAELLGLVNAILATPSLPSSDDGSDRSSPPPYNVDLCVECSGLLSWSLALIDSLQRSSTKQLQTHLSSLPAESQHLLRCLSSYEMKSTRERVVLSSLLQQHQLSLLSYAVISEIILESCGFTPDGSDGGGVVDVEHLFQMLLGCESSSPRLLTASGPSR